MIRDYGEDRFAKNIAKHIVIERKKSPVETTGELIEIIKKAIPMKFQKMPGHPAKRTFQAIRIELNRELEVLKESLDDMIEMLNPGGRLCIITFHSLEDRLVKQRFRRWATACTCPPELPVCVCGGRARAKLVYKKPLEADEREKAENRRARSAKLRVIEKLEEP